MYFIDRLALRAGNEKGDDEADTYGCCSLQFEHVTLEPPNIVKFDFLGKDSMRFQQEVPVEPQVFKNIKLFKKEPKTVGDDLFDRLNVSAPDTCARTKSDSRLVYSTNISDHLCLVCQPRCSVHTTPRGLSRSN
jgi:DNA topoisomerase IB